jgi:hypothetical protein
MCLRSHDSGIPQAPVKEPARQVEHGKFQRVRPPDANPAVALRHCGTHHPLMHLVINTRPIDAANASRIAWAHARALIAMGELARRGQDRKHASTVGAALGLGTYRRNSRSARTPSRISGDVAANSELSDSITYCDGSSFSALAVNEGEDIVLCPAPNSCCGHSRTPARPLSGKKGRNHANKR